MRKPTICICETKGADQLRSNCEADQCLCFRYTDCTIPLLQPFSVLVLDLFGNHIVGFLMTWRKLIYIVNKYSLISSAKPVGLQIESTEL